MRFTKYYEPAFTPTRRACTTAPFRAAAGPRNSALQDLGNALYYHALAQRRRLIDACGGQPHPHWQFRPHFVPPMAAGFIRAPAGEGQVGDKDARTCI